MILLDANVLLYAYDETSPHHERARVWLERTLAAPAPVGLPWATVLAFLRISTNARALQRPLTLEAAIGIVDSWFEQPCVTLVAPGPQHYRILCDLLRNAQAKGPLVTDAHLAALALEHGAAVATSDRDFSRFSGLRVVNPLLEPA
ncbi:MAG: type II toxin-antitoxin system VapC family toxin [Deltaproteobacteria bacterium]|nr:type II toxin-antitoxin system VapC family toxin [Deltaproteobacteria bacterium]